MRRALLGFVCVTLVACAPDPPAAVVSIVVDGCGPRDTHAVGTIVEPGLVLTAAHPLIGAQMIEVTDHNDRRAVGTIVAFDPANDLASLRVTAPLSGITPLPVAAPGTVIERGEVGVTYLYRNGDLTRHDVTVERPITINTDDIYRDAAVSRPGYEISSAIEPGDSGAPVVVDGEIIGVIWARSTSTDARAYAIDVVRGAANLTAQRTEGVSTDLTRCP